ncbi:hypothetical protein [Microbulbifer sp.]|uniref:hypothetical protein n=1 Tax=Microbulbifer sp. TaxID=1908541 RepID=UPI003F3DB0EB
MKYYYLCRDDDDQETVPVSAQRFQPRTNHEAVAFNGKLWVIGGSQSNGRNNNVGSSEDGHSWVLEADAAAFGDRQYHQIVEFKGKLRLLGGSSGNLYYQDIYSSEDRVNWTLEGTSPKAMAVGPSTLISRPRRLGRTISLALASHCRRTAACWRSALSRNTALPPASTGIRPTTQRRSAALSTFINSLIDRKRVEAGSGLSQPTLIGLSRYPCGRLSLHFRCAFDLSNPQLSEFIT